MVRLFNDHWWGSSMITGGSCKEEHSGDLFRSRKNLGTPHRCIRVQRLSIKFQIFEDQYSLWVHGYFHSLNHEHPWQQGYGQTINPKSSASSSPHVVLSGSLVQRPLTLEIKDARQNRNWLGTHSTVGLYRKLLSIKQAYLLENLRNNDSQIAHGCTTRVHL